MPRLHTRTHIQLNRQHCPRSIRCNNNPKPRRRTVTHSHNTRDSINEIAIARPSIKRTDTHKHDVCVFVHYYRNYVYYRLNSYLRSKTNYKRTPIATSPQGNFTNQIETKDAHKHATIISSHSHINYDDGAVLVTTVARRTAINPSAAHARTQMCSMLGAYRSVPRTISAF